MTSAPLRECAHEREVLDLVLAERWPDRADPDVVGHAASCEICADVVAVALAMREDEARVESAIVAGTPHHPSVVPDATLVWWRSQLRAHEDAGRKAARPVAMVQGIGIGIGLVALASLVRLAWPWLRAGSDTALLGAASFGARVVAASAAVVGALPLWLTLSIVAAVIVGPILTYAALGRD